jgi:hypothetical protein
MAPTHMCQIYNYAYFFIVLLRGYGDSGIKSIGQPLTVWQSQLLFFFCFSHCICIAQPALITLHRLHLAAHKPRGPGFAAMAIVASLHLKHKTAIALTRPAVSTIAVFIIVTYIFIEWENIIEKRLSSAATTTATTCFPLLAQRCS